MLGGEAILQSSAAKVKRPSEVIATRARNMLWLAFGTMGVMANAWVPRIPEIKHALHMSNSQFGVVLLGSPIGLVIGAQLAGRMIHTFGSRRVALIAGLEMSGGLILLGIAHSKWSLVIALFVMGIGYSAIDNAVNTQAVAVEKILDRRYMSGFHGSWSVGALIAAAIGGLLAHHTTSKENIVGVGIISFVVFIPNLLNLLPDNLDGHAGHEEVTSAKIPFFGKGTGILWLIGFGLIGCLIPEAAASDWAGILLHEHMRIGTGLDASAFGAFALAMIVGRFSGDHLMMKYGAERIVKYGGYIGGVTLGACIAIAVPVSSFNIYLGLGIIIFGFIIAGLGIGPMVPAFISATGRMTAIAPSVAIARVGVIGLLAYYIGPVVTGSLADLFSLPVAMAFPCSVLILAGYLSKTVRAPK
ncbi:MAG: MFS transporter [Actinomycetes bacterium]